jgi:hypothetical protein
LSVSIHALRSAIADWQQKPRMIKTMTEVMILRFEFAVAILISFFIDEFMETCLSMNDLMGPSFFICVILLQETIICQDNAGIKMLCWRQILRKSSITTGRGRFAGRVDL